MLRWLWQLRSAPLLVAFAMCYERTTIRLDVRRWLDIIHSDQDSGMLGLLWLLSHYREFRNLFYFRVGRGQGGMARALLGVLRFIYPGYPCLVIHCGDLGPGLYIQHGLCTVISAESIGSNCWVSQQVTIGHDELTRRLGNNVRVTAGAKVIGGVRVGDNVTIGANAVVVKDVPPNCVVVGVPAYVVRRNGRRVREELT